MFDADSASFRTTLPADQECTPQAPHCPAAQGTTHPVTNPPLLPHRGKTDAQQVIAAAKEALGADPENPLLYLALGKAYLAADKKHLALYAFRKGLKYGHHRALVNEIRRLGFRRPPTFPFLGRKHPLNIYAGRLLCWLGWR